MSELIAGTDSKERPVFVVGASRSGTALLRSALNLSPGVFLAGETHYFDDLRPRLAVGAEQRLEGEALQTCQDYFLALSHRPYGHGGELGRARLDRSDLQRAADELGGSGDAYFEAYCRMSAVLETHPPGPFTRWGEKTPRHVFRLTDMLTRYPAAQVVALYRDPRAVAASYGNWRQQGGLAVTGDQGYDESLREEERRARASYDPSVVSLLWRATVRAGEAARTTFGERRVRLLRYEDLATDPSGSLQQLADWLGIDFMPGMLEVPMHNSSFSAFARGSGVSTDPMERWRRTLPPHEVAIVEHWCSDGLDALGYEQGTGGLSPLARARVLAAVPRAGARAVWVNRSRAGSMPSYVWRRLRLMRT